MKNILKEYYFKLKIGRQGLSVFYIIEVESNSGTHYYDTINMKKLWSENPYTKVFTTRKEAEEFISDKRNHNIIKWGIESGGYRCRLESVKVVPRVGKIVKDEEGKGLFPFRDMFIQSPEHNEELDRYKF